MVQVQQEKELIFCTFPCQFYLLRAYEKTGLYDQTAEVWGALKQQLDLHLTTLPETPADSRSDCHAWSALLLYEFPRKMLGVSAMSPGYQSILVEPKAWYLQEASGIVHTPKGEISISWRLEEGKAVLQLEHRCNVPVEVRLPDGRICRADSFGKWESLCILDKDKK